MGNRRGQAIALAYMAVLVMTILGGSLLTHSVYTHQDSQLQQTQADLLYMAEGGIEDTVSRFSQAIANFQLSSTTACYPDTNNDAACTPDTATGTDVVTTTFANGAVARSWVTQAAAGQQTVTDPDGTAVFVKNYQVNATVTSNGMTTTLHQMIARRIIYTFQHAVFYDGDLEWLPGADMTLTGRVHSNSDMYLGTHALLTIDDDYVRAAGKIFNRRKDSTTPMNGVVQIKKAGTSPSAYAAMAGLDSDSASWAAESQTRWLGTVRSDVHGVTKRAVPVVGSTAPGGFYDSHADVKITNNTVVQNGSTLVEGVNIPPGTITSSTSFFNNREAKTVKMTEVNLRKLAGWYDCNNDSVEEQCYPNHLPTNGLLYATRTDASASQQPGIRLIKGTTIERTDGLTIVSNQPVYVQGTYNTTGKKPAAVIADALNLLSNAWDDNSCAGCSGNNFSNRVASATTINNAFIAGVETTVAGQYNGGLENYPRLHENWSGKTLSIRGSFVSLWESQLAKGNWVYGSPYYTAPVRNWNYETDFANGERLPPFTPLAVEVVKGAWWKD